MWKLFNNFFDFQMKKANKEIVRKMEFYFYFFFKINV